MARSVVVTGASQGIGAGLARELTRRGDGVTLAARGEAALKEVAAACGPNALAVRADVTRRENVEALRDAAIARFGHIDAWVNNAGQGIHTSVLDLTDEDIDAILDSNLRSVIYGAQAVVPHFKERGQGHLINISSFLGRVPRFPHRSIYNAAKAAVNAITSNLRTDLRGTPGIRVSLVLPGVVATQFPQNVRGQKDPPFVVGQQVGNQRVQSVEEVAAMVADLLDHPADELYTNPATPPLVMKYFEDVGAFEEAMATQRR